MDHPQNIQIVLQLDPFDRVVSALLSEAGGGSPLTQALTQLSQTQGGDVHPPEQEGNGEQVSLSCAVVGLKLWRQVSLSWNESTFHCIWMGGPRKASPDIAAASSTREAFARRRYI